MSDIPSAPEAAGEGTWHDLAADAEVGPDEVIGRYGPDGHDFGLLRWEGQVHAFDNLCSHGHARLCDGFVLDQEVECPLHQARFDVTSGAVTCGPATEAVRCYPVRIEGGRVLVRR